MNKILDNQTEELEEVEVLDEQIEEFNLIIFNDDVNTFDHVIETLVKVCKHNAIQAEQCTHIIHHNGKCQVKVGSYKKLEPLCTAILERGISAEIQ